jgi:hypothetical protein
MRSWRERIGEVWSGLASPFVEATPSEDDGYDTNDHDCCNDAAYNGTRAFFVGRWRGRAGARDIRMF